MSDSKWYYLVMLSKPSWQQIANLIFSKINILEVRYAASASAAKSLGIQEVDKAYIRIIGFELTPHGLLVIGNWGEVRGGAQFYIRVTKLKPPERTASEFILAIQIPKHNR